MITAACDGDLAKIQHLQKEGVSVNCSDYDKRTPLHLASSEGHLNVVQWLFEHGATINAEDRWGGTPLRDALKHKHSEVSKYLVEHGGKTLLKQDDLVASLCVAAKDGNISELEHLMQAGADVNIGDYDQRTALHLAAAEGRLEAVQWLINKGAVVNSVDRFGGTALQDALRCGHQNVAEFLIKQGAHHEADPSKLRQKPQFGTSLQQALTIICSKEGWDYGVAWLTDKEKILPSASLWYSKEDVATNVAPFHTQAFIEKRSAAASVAHSVAQSQTPQWGDEKDVDSQLLGFRGSVGVPVSYNQTILAVLVFHSKTHKEKSQQAVNYITEVAGRVIIASLIPGTWAQAVASSDFQSVQGVFQEQMSLVFAMIVSEGIFNVAVIKEEVDWYYNHLGLDRYYFERFSPAHIAKHIHSFIAAKKLAQTTGTAENIELTYEEHNTAFYIRPSESSSYLAVERSIEKNYMNEGYEGGNSLRDKQNAVSVVAFRSTGTASRNSKVHLSLYIVDCAPFIDGPQPEESTDVYKISTGVFLRDKRPEILERYEHIIQKSAGKLAPVVELYPGGHVMLAYKSGSTHSYFSGLSMLIARAGLVCIKKYVEHFANGIVAFSFYLPEATQEQLQDLINSASFLYILPRTTLTPLFDSGKLTAEEIVYAYAAWKFSYHFVSRESEEYKVLYNALKDDRVNEDRLKTLKKSLRRELATETRCSETIFNHWDLVKLCYQEFEKNHKPNGAEKPKPHYNVELEAKFLKVATNELDLEILKQILKFNANILKTNFFKKQKVALSFRLDPTFLSLSDYQEIPVAIFLIVGSEFRGFHVRFQDIARGGVRMIQSRNQQTYTRNVETVFDENFNLAHTQDRKNKDIPEGGSKGTILLSLQHQSSASSAFRKYVDSMLDLLLLPNSEIVDHYAKPEIIFLGPDEGTADFMDWAALHAKSRGASFWGAFTTGKSVELGGIPHDLYGMTTRGVHQYVLGILKKVNLDESTVTKFQTGGPDGDLGSNEIKISKDKTIGVVDGSGVLYDPAGLNREELLRLATKRKMIKDFDKAKLGPGGFVILIDENDVKLPDGTIVESGLHFRNTFHLNPLCAATLFVPCGGRPEAVNVNNVNKLFDPKTGKPFFKYVVEGANLFFTQESRIILEKAGVIVFKDASANKGGVTSSSLEVLSALALPTEEFDKQMCVKDGVIPEFYAAYVQEVQRRIEENASLEFECIWNEKEKNPHAFLSELTNVLSEKINSMNNFVQKSSLWNRTILRERVLQEALPNLLIEKVGLPTLLKRIPENYLKAIFGAHLASRYVYEFGLSGNEFSVFEFMERYLN